MGIYVIGDKRGDTVTKERYERVLREVNDLKRYLRDRT